MPPDPMTMEAPPKKKPMLAIGIKVEKPKMKPNTFTPPKGYASDNDDEVKEALLKFKEMPDGSCMMISLDGAPFKEGKMPEDEEESPASQSTEEQSPEEEEPMPSDLPMEDAITTLQKRARKY